MSTSAIGSVLDALRAALVLRPGLAGVNVFSGPVSLEEAGLECLAFGDARLNEESLSAGGNRVETWAVDGETRVVAFWRTDTETTIQAARSRALAILAEIESHVNDTYTGRLPDVEISSGEMAQIFNTEGRVCSCFFTLTVRAAKNP